MTTYPDTHHYVVTIVNHTLETLQVVRTSIAWGVWHRNGVDGDGPTAVPPGQAVEALGIRASKTNTKGYEFRCAWGTEAGDPRFPDAVSLFISVPLLAGGNRAGLDVSGRFRVAGWTGISRIGHAFTHTLVVTLA